LAKNSQFKCPFGEKKCEKEQKYATFATNSGNCVGINELKARVKLNKGLILIV
jgi:hypothetical protein